MAITVSADHPEIEAVVAESPFSSYRDVVARFAKLFYGVPRVPFVQLTLFIVEKRLGVNAERFSPVHHIARISPRPVFIIQGDQDARMPPIEGERLYAAAREPKTLWTIPGADHGQASEMAGEEYQNRVLDFYARVFSDNSR